MSEMGKLTFGYLRDAWQGEATHFTPLLAEQLDAIGSEIGVELSQVGEIEVDTAGGRRIDIVASDADHSEFVIENQYGRADHDHLTRGLAYAVARHARGLIVVAEEHRDEFRAVAQYLNDLAESSDIPAVAVWLVEAKAVRIGDSPWAPLFTTVVKPNSFVRSVQEKPEVQRVTSVGEFLERTSTDEVLQAASQVISPWLERGGNSHWFGPNYIALVAKGPAAGGVRSVVRIYTDGSVSIPFSSYEGGKTGLRIDSISGPEFRAATAQQLGAPDLLQRATTQPGWLTEARVAPLLSYCHRVADEYEKALQALEEPGETVNPVG